MNWRGWLSIMAILIPLPAAAQDADRSQTPQASSAEEWQRQIPDIRRRMELVMGPLPGVDRRVPLEVEMTPEERTDRYVRRKLRYTPEPGDRVPAWLLIPHTATATTPAAIPVPPSDTWAWPRPGAAAACEAWAGAGAGAGAGQTCESSQSRPQSRALWPRSVSSGRAK